MARVIEHGDYTNESEYIRDLLRRDREAKEHDLWVEEQIQIGLDSGESDATIPEIMENVKAKMRADPEREV